MMIPIDYIFAYFFSDGWLNHRSGCVWSCKVNGAVSVVSNQRKQSMQSHCLKVLGHFLSRPKRSAQNRQKPKSKMLNASIASQLALLSTTWLIHIWASYWCFGLVAKTISMSMVWTGSFIPSGLSRLLLRIWFAELRHRNSWVRSVPLSVNVMTS